VDSHDRKDTPLVVAPEELLEDLATQGIEWLVREPWGVVGLHEYRGFCFIHCRIWQWSKQNRKACVEHWKLVRSAVRERGYSVMYAGCSLPDRKGYKFRQLFGFVEVVKLPQVGQVLMKQEI